MRAIHRLALSLIIDSCKQILNDKMGKAEVIAL